MGAIQLLYLIEFADWDSQKKSEMVPHRPELQMEPLMQNKTIPVVQQKIGQHRFNIVRLKISGEMECLSNMRDVIFDTTLLRIVSGLQQIQRNIPTDGQTWTILLAFTIIAMATLVVCLTVLRVEPFAEWCFWKFYHIHSRQVLFVNI